jgi:hypothetical protein
MTGKDESTEEKERSRTLSERVGVRADRGRLSQWKRVIPYPSSVDIRSREIEPTVNSEWLRPKLHVLRHYSRKIRGVVGVTAAVLLLLSVFVAYITVELRVFLAGVSILLAVLTSLRFRVVAKAEPVEVQATPTVASASVQYSNEDDEH